MPYVDGTSLCIYDFRCCLTFILSVVAMKIIREPDQKIAGEETNKTDRKPLMVVLVWWLCMVISLGIFGIFTYGLLGIFFQFLKK